MPDFACPKCHAAIEPDLLETTGRAECPFCGADLSSLNLPAPSAAPLGEERSGELAASTSAGITRDLPPLPEKSLIRIVESTPERLVLFIPGGGKQATGLGCFALFWNLFMCLFTPPWFIGAFQGKGDGPPMLVMIPFLGLFWAVGLGMAYFWFRMKYQRTFLLLDRDRLAVQTVLLNRKKLVETLLTPESRAELVESYQQNDVPVYRIEVKGSNAAAKFGTALDQPEKDWICDRINEFLGVERSGDEPSSAATKVQANLVFPSSCDKCGAPLPAEPVYGVLVCPHCGATHRGAAPVSVPPTDEPAVEESYEPLRPEDLPTDSLITIDENTRETLRLHYSAAGNSVLRWVIPLFTLPFALAWYAGIFGFMGIGGLGAVGFGQGGFGNAIGGWIFFIVVLLFMIPFVLAGLIPLGIGLFAARGRITTTLTAEKLTARWHLGPLGYSRSLPVSEITSLRLETGEDFQRRNPRVALARRTSTRASSDSRACIARTSSRMLLLTFMQSDPALRQLTSLLRTRLADMGHPL